MCNIRDSGNGGQPRASSRWSAGEHLVPHLLQDQGRLLGMAIARVAGPHAASEVRIHPLRRSAPLSTPSAPPCCSAAHLSLPPSACCLDHLLQDQGRLLGGAIARVAGPRAASEVRIHPLRRSALTAPRLVAVLAPRARCPGCCARSWPSVRWLTRPGGSPPTERAQLSPPSTPGRLHASRFHG